MSDGSPEILHHAIVRNLGLVLSLPSAGMLRHHKSRFLSAEEEGFWVESIPAERLLIDSLIDSRQPVGIAFKSATSKVVFLTPILRWEENYRINAETAVTALLLALPSEIKSIQRRNNYRVRIRQESDLSLHIWRIGERVHLKDRPMAAAELPVTLHDISTGGLGVTFLAKEGQPVRVTPEDRLRIQLSYQETSFLIEGRMRPSTRACEKGLRSGVQFKALQNDLEGRQTLAQLTKIIGELQRDEVRRMRIGIA